VSFSPASRREAQTAGLRALANCGGCAAKAGPELVNMLASTAAAAGVSNGALLAGLDPYDDAAVYQLDAERALVSTVDFFPPLLDDPYDYGTVAAANAVSDVYAMGGEVAFALVVSGFPESVPPASVAAATAGAAEVIAECGGQIVGGHSIHCVEPVFGLAVTGHVHPDRIWRKSGAQAGDALMLSKPLGTGLLLSEDSAASVDVALESMQQTNRASAQALSGSGYGPNAVTDVTGYGLLGHASELAERSGVTIRIDSARVPLLPGAVNAAQRGVRTSADGRQRRSLGGSIRLSKTITEDLIALLYDPQTSGGLLAAVPSGETGRLRQMGFSQIGFIESGDALVVVD